MVVGAIIGALAPVVASSTIQAVQANRARQSGKRTPGEFLKLALDIQALSERGLTPILDVDPFTGGLVLSTTDQSASLFNLLGERFAKEALAGTPEESAAGFALREAFIQTAPGFPTPVQEEPTVRDQVVAALSTTTAKVVAPGIVAKKSSSLVSTRRLGGPCAGANTGFSRLNCARGGFS